MGRLRAFYSNWASATVLAALGHNSDGWYKEGKREGDRKGGSWTCLRPQCLNISARICISMHCACSILEYIEPLMTQFGARKLYVKHRPYGHAYVDLATMGKVGTRRENKLTGPMTTRGWGADLFKSSSHIPCLLYIYISNGTCRFGTLNYLNSRDKPAKVYIHIL